MVIGMREALTHLYRKTLGHARSSSLRFFFFFFGLCERRSKPAKEMRIPLRQTPKGGTLCCRLYTLGDSQKSADLTT